MWLTLEPEAGQSIQQAVKEAQRVAIALQVDVQFDFNGSLIIVSPGSDGHQIVADYIKSRR